MVGWTRRCSWMLTLVMFMGCAGTARVPASAPGGTVSETGPDAAVRESGSETAQPEPPANSQNWRARLLRAEDIRKVDAAVHEGLNSGDAELRRLSVRALGRIADPAMADSIVEALGDEHPDVRTEAVFAAAITGLDKAHTQIVALRSDDNSNVRATVALALGILADPAGLDPLRSLLADPIADVRIAASYSAPRFDSPEPLVVALLQLLEDTDLNVSRAATYGLSRISAQLGAISFEDRVQLRSRLVQLAGVKDAHTRAFVAEGLYNPMAGEQADTLAKMLEDSDEVMVILAILRATSFPGAPTSVIHEKLVDHRDPMVVYAMVRSLGRMRGAWVNDVLFTTILYEKRDWLQAAAIRALNEADDRVAFQVSNGLTIDTNPMILGAAAEVLYGRVERDAGEYAHRLWTNDHPWVRLHAIPAMASVEEPLTEIFEEIYETCPLEMKVQMARAAGYRLAHRGRTDASYMDALSLLSDLWEAGATGAVALQLAVIDAAGEGNHEGGKTLIRDALEAEDYVVRRHAATVLAERFGDRVEVEPRESKPLAYYEQVLEWAAKRQAAIVTVYRPGFDPGWFSISLDTVRAPLTTWRFAEAASRGYYDQRRVGDFVPGLRLHSGSGGDKRYAGSGWSPEPVISTFPPGTLAAVPSASGDLLGEWMVTMALRPTYLGRFHPFGRVVQNLSGVAGNVLPIDQVVSVKVYEGTGSEPLGTP